MSVYVLRPSVALPHRDWMYLTHDEAAHVVRAVALDERRSPKSRCVRRGRTWTFGCRVAPAARPSPRGYVELISWHVRSRRCDVERWDAPHAPPIETVV